MHDILKENTSERISKVEKILQKAAAWWKLLSPGSVTGTMAERFCDSQMLTNLTFAFPSSQEPPHPRGHIPNPKTVSAKP